MKHKLVSVDSCINIIFTCVITLRIDCGYIFKEWCVYGQYSIDFCPLVGDNMHVFDNVCSLCELNLIMFSKTVFT